MYEVLIQIVFKLVEKMWVTVFKTAFFHEHFIFAIFDILHIKLSIETNPLQI